MEKKKSFRPTVSQYRELEKELEQARIDNNALRQSNKLMEAEMEKVHAANASLNELNDSLHEELLSLKTRGFWARLFNR